MTDSAPLSWSPIEWEDPCGGIIRLWPFLPNVVLTSSLRRTAGDWHGLAFLLPDDESPDLSLTHRSCPKSAAVVICWMPLSADAIKFSTNASKQPLNL
ncbi:MAG: hypothetical protein QF612_06095, partial [Candidatus Thalassarchaeaceae archaeon]|nr:hypothetical protein [Candidatus Thalassarchaeaceae archaeon]